jgi:arginase family enzyme
MTSSSSIQPHQGVAKSPDLIRQSGLIETLTAHHEFIDFGNVTHVPVEETTSVDNMKNPANVLAYAKKVRGTFQWFIIYL